jgi:hypothetical protein
VRAAERASDGGRSWRGAGPVDLAARELDLLPGVLDDAKNRNHELQQYSSVDGRKHRNHRHDDQQGECPHNAADLERKNDQAQIVDADGDYGSRCTAA